MPARRATGRWRSAAGRRRAPARASLSGLARWASRRGLRRWPTGLEHQRTVVRYTPVAARTPGLEIRPDTNRLRSLRSRRQALHWRRAAAFDSDLDTEKWVPQP